MARGKYSPALFPVDDRKKIDADPFGSLPLK
jgi:hypothetical protein